MSLFPVRFCIKRSAFIFICITDILLCDFAAGRFFMCFIRLLDFIYVICPFAGLFSVICLIERTSFTYALIVLAGMAADDPGSLHFHTELFLTKSMADRMEI